MKERYDETALHRRPMRMGKPLLYARPLCRVCIAAIAPSLEPVVIAQTPDAVRVSEFYVHLLLFLLNCVLVLAFVALRSFCGSFAALQLYFYFSQRRCSSRSVRNHLLRSVTQLSSNRYEREGVLHFVNCC